MRKFAAAIAVLVAGTSMMTGAPASGGSPSATALLEAAESGDRPTALRLLTTKGTDLNATAADGSTAIMYAAANGDIELVRALIKAGANVKLANQFGTSAITEA